MPNDEGVTIGVLVERLEGVREDVAELRRDQRDDHHRLRSVESAVQKMIDAQQVARASEVRQYRRLASAVQVGGVAIALAMMVLAIVTLVAHTG